MQDYKKLDIWKRSIALVKSIYKLCHQLPKNEEYGLSSQMKRCAISIPSNIAEGASRTSKKDFNRFLEISLGSAFELETQLMLVKELGMINRDLIRHQIDDITILRKMLYSFMQKVKP